MDIRKIINLLESVENDSQLNEYRAQEIVHKNPTISALKALAKNNRFHSCRFVIYKDGTVVAADSANFTHNSMAPAMGEWAVKGYVQYMGNDDYAYRSMEPYSAINKYHPIFKHWERSGIEDGNSDQSHLSHTLDEKRSDWEIYNYHKLDVILVKLCELVVNGQRQDPDTHGMVAAAILDPDNRLVSSTGRKIRGKWHHAERCAMMKYEQLHGDIPNGSICITTCSPCSERMGDRYEESCTDLINRSNIHKVYAGYDDPTQPEEQRHFNIIETSNPAIRAFCHQLAESFMDWEAQQASDSLSETWSKKYKRSINCKNPRGFSQRAHCAARKKRQRHALTKSKSVRENLEHDDVENQNLPSVNQAKALMPQILAKAQKIYDDWDESDRDTYAGGGICHIIADGICDVLGQTGIDCTPVSCSMEQHVYVVAKFDEGIYEIDIPYHVYEQGGGYSWTKIPDIKFETGDVKFQKLSGDPDEWENYIDENFADGKGPGRPGDSRRHGIPKNATMAQLQKAAKAPGRKGQLARWQINMRRGHSKK